MARGKKHTPEQVVTRLLAVAIFCCSVYYLRSGSTHAARRPRLTSLLAVGLLFCSLVPVEMRASPGFIPVWSLFPLALLICYALARDEKRPFWRISTGAAAALSFLGLVTTFPWLLTAHRWF